MIVSAARVCPRCGAEYGDEVVFCAKDGTRLTVGAAAADLAGTVVADRYRVDRLLGEGGMGQVWLAEHVRMRRRCAIKIMRPALVGDTEALQRFTREAESASQISHPNVAAIHDFGETADGLVYLAMEYVDGESLAAKLKRELVLHPDVAADVVGQAADALQAAHDLGILHRDFKPDNVMLAKRPDGTFLVKLVDFGIARTADPGAARVTRTGFAVGTPDFMAPEQLAGDRLDARADQYALALVAFVALTGKDAFPGESSKESLIARLTSRPRTLQEAKQDVQWPDSLQAVFDRALSPNAEDRFARVADFAEALGSAISGMTPSQTAAIYRRALDQRVASLALRTPHSDAAITPTPKPQSAVRDVATPATAGDVEARDAQDGPTLEAAALTLSRVPSLQQTRAVPAVEAGGGAQVGEVAGGSAGDAGRAVADGPASAASSAAAASSAGRAIVPLAGAATLLLVVVGAWLALRGGGTDGAPAVSSDVVRDSAEVAPPSVEADALAASPTAAGAAGTGSAGGAGSGIVSSAVTGPGAGRADSLRRARRDSVARAGRAAQAAGAAQAEQDSAARRADARSRFPEEAIRATLAGGAPDMRLRMARGSDLAIHLLTPPVAAWRAERARAWKASHVRADTEQPFDRVDPIEAWAGWAALVEQRRPVVVLDAGADRRPWPELVPERLLDLRRGDVMSLQLLRDGAAVDLLETARIPSVADTAAHIAANRPVPRSFIAVVPAEAFQRRPDGSVPRLELLVQDAMNRSRIVRITIPDAAVRVVSADLQPWFDRAGK